MLMNSKHDRLDVISEELLRICLNIFPCGSSFMEMLLKYEQRNSTEEAAHTNDSSNKVI